MNRSRITGAILLRWDDCTSILSKHLTTLLQRPIQLCRMVEDYDYWCVASINGRFSIPELHSLLDALSATTVDFPDLIPEESNQTRSFSMEFSRALLQHLPWVGHTEADREFSGIFFNIHCVYRSVPPDRAADSLSHLRQCPQ